MNTGQIKQGEGDNSITYMIVGCILFFVLSFLINKYSATFYDTWRSVMLPVVKGIDWVANSLLGNLLNPLLKTSKVQANSLILFLKETPADKITFTGFSAVNTFIGKYMLVLLLPTGVYLTVKLFRSTQGFDKPYMKLRSWKAARDYFLPISYRRIIENNGNKSLYEGKMASAMSCLQFCETNHIVALDKQTGKVIEVNQKMAYRALVTQLGRPFSTREILLNSSIGWVIASLKNHIPAHHQKEALDFALTGHQYEYTACLSLLYVARRFGVVSTRDYLPLKISHRSLWYALISAGRKTVFIEGAAIIAQFEHELTCKLLNAEESIRPKLVHIDAALDGLLQALEEDYPEKPWLAAQSLWKQFDSMRY